MASRLANYLVLFYLVQLLLKPQTKMVTRFDSIERYQDLSSDYELLSIHDNALFLEGGLSRRNSIKRLPCKGTALRTVLHQMNILQFCRAITDNSKYQVPFLFRIPV